MAFGRFNLDISIPIVLFSTLKIFNMNHTHKPSFKTDFITWVILMILTVVTVALAYITGGNTAFAVALALLVATVKALVVLFNFMHIRWDHFLYKIYIAVVAFLFLAFMVFLVVDYGLRT